MRFGVSLVVAIAAAALSPGGSGAAPPSPRADLNPPVILRGEAAFAPAAVDTHWFGGTVWAPDSARWEAIPGGTWTFDSGVGSAFIPFSGGGTKAPGLHRLMEGWAGWDLTAEETLPWFRRLTAADFAAESAICVGTSAGLGGSASLYAGVLTPEADARFWASGRGYGNRWLLVSGKTFSYPGSGTVLLEFDYANETEPGFDYTFVEIDTTGNGSAPPVAVAQFGGTVGGHGSYLLDSTAGTLPSTAGNFTVRFRVDSDGAYSDEDGSYATTCGAFAVDNVALSGAVTDLSDFESGDDGWSILPNAPGPGGDWSDILSTTFLPNPPPAGCTLSDSALVFYNRNTGLIEADQYNVAVSPWIDLQRAGVVDLPGHLIEFDAYFDYERPEYVTMLVLVQVRPAPPGEGGFFVPYSCLFGPDPCLSVDGCTAPGSPMRLVVDSNLIASGAEEVRIAVGVDNQCELWGPCPGPNTDSTPYFDNIRFAAYDTTGSTTAVPGDGSGPLLALGLDRSVTRSGPVHFSATVPAGAAADLKVFDVRGHLVARLHEGRGTGETIQVEWDLQGEDGRRVPGGVYFARLGGKRGVTARVVVLR